MSQPIGSDKTSARGDQPRVPTGHSQMSPRPARDRWRDTFAAGSRSGA